MPRHDIDRDAYVRQMERRVRWAWRTSRVKRLLTGDKTPVQAAAYDRAFRSDAEAVTYHYAARNDHLPDFDDPTWINEKVRWQFLNHPNPLMGIAADKAAVREYLTYKNAQIRAPELLAVGEGKDEFLAADLPDRFVLKSTSGWAQNRFVDGLTDAGRQELGSSIAEWDTWDHWRVLGELHYRGIPKRWLAEQVIGPVSRITEYKFYCIMGEPQFFMYMTDRSGNDARCSLFDLQWRPTPFHWSGYPPTAERPEKRPALYEKMLAEARRLSEDFLHVRVDFLECDGQAYFSELTFAGGGARNPFLPRIQNEVFAEMMDLRRAEDYARLGRAVHSTLAMPIHEAA
jgi:hypothetical protein